MATLTEQIELKRTSRRTFRVTIGACAFDIEVTRRPGGWHVDKPQSVYVQPPVFERLCALVRNALKEAPEE